MQKLLNSADQMTLFRRRLISGGMDPVNLFYRELMSCKALPGHSCAALATDVHAVYVAWCARLGFKPRGISHFVRELKAKCGVIATRHRYTLDGKQSGPHCVLTLKSEASSLSEQIGVFHRLASEHGTELLECM